MDTKYFAYYIPNNFPQLITDLQNQLRFVNNPNNDLFKKPVATVQSKYKLIEGLLNYNDWQHILCDYGCSNNYQINKDSFGSLVLVKFTNVSKIINSNFNEDMYSNVVKYSEFIANVAPSNPNYKMMDQLLFSGKTRQEIHFTNNNGNNGNNSNNGNNNQTESILAEKIFIPLPIDLQLVNLPGFKGKYDPNNFNLLFNAIKNIIDTYEPLENVDEPAFDFDNAIVNILFSILLNIKNDAIYSQKYTNMQTFMPLVDNSIQNTVKIMELWNRISRLTIDDPNNPYDFLSYMDNYMTNGIKIPENEHHGEMNVKTFANLFITSKDKKSFDDITFQDALPFKSYFIINENNISEYNSKFIQYNTKAYDIENRKRYLERGLHRIRRQEEIDAVKVLVEAEDDKYTELLETIPNIDFDYRKHILYNTHIGIRLTEGKFLMNNRVITFLKHYCNNKVKVDKVNKNIMNFKIGFEAEKIVINFYLKNQFINDIINLKITNDLFIINKLIKIETEDMYCNKLGIQFNQHFNTKCKIDKKTKSIEKFNEFIKNNLALDLFEYQKNNVLWMTKLEDEIDKNNLSIKSYIGKYGINWDHIEDIKIYLVDLRRALPEHITKQYVINYNNTKYLVDLGKCPSLAQGMSLLTFLNSPGYQINQMAMELVRCMQPYDNYLIENSKDIHFNGGVICDEVGLGKTLSIISHLVVKMQNDMEKYGEYKRDMKSVYDEIEIDSKHKFKDPLEWGFEYNNLVIVPSRLTSQWESEIQKYVKDKFNLRAKVLVGIQSVKILEKELRQFKQKQNKNDNTNENNDDTNDDTNNTNANDKKKKIRKSKKETEKIEINVEQLKEDEKQKEKQKEKEKENKKHLITKKESKLLIENIAIPEVIITEKETEPVVKKYKLKQSKKIEKLMEQAKKANQKLELKKDNTSGITFDNILNNEVGNEVGNEETIVNENIDKVVNEQLEKEETETQSETDEYEYINKYIEQKKSSLVNNEYKKDQLYDIYIVSINLLSNDNYLDYIGHSHHTHFSNIIGRDLKEEGQEAFNKKLKLFNTIDDRICRLTDKFDIFKIKWNRVILDEAHEKLAPLIKVFATELSNMDYKMKHKYNVDEQLLYESLCMIQANYKWGMTGTPDDKGADSMSGILQFISKRNPNASKMENIEHIRYFGNLLGISKNNFELIINKLFKKTDKQSVKDLLNIPIFTEEVINVEQTNIERNIYNSIRASRHFTESVKQRRLFLMCTNILINEGYDFSTENDIKPNNSASEEVLTLEQLNANMISKFNKELENVKRTETNTIQNISRLERTIPNWTKIKEHVAGLRLIDVINNLDYKELYDKFGDPTKTLCKQSCEIFYSLMEIYECWNNLANIGTIMQSNIMNIRNTLSRFWRPHWGSTTILTQCSGWSAGYGVQKANDDIAKNRKHLEQLKNDMKRINNQIVLFSSNEFLKGKTSDPCIICFEDLNEFVVTPCRHVFCLNCTKHISNDLKNQFNCPECRTQVPPAALNITTVEMINKEAEPVVEVVEPVVEGVENGTTQVEEVIPEPQNELERKLGVDWKMKCVNKYGSKMAKLVEYLYKLFEKSENRVIIFSQYDKMLRMIGTTLDEYAIKFVYCCGNNYVLNRNINKFKKDETIRVIMLSSETSNSGSNLTEANHIIFIDVLFHEKHTVKAIEAQAIGRAVRLGQKLPVKVVRFITKDTIEAEHYERNKYDMNSIQ